MREKNIHGERDERKEKQRKAITKKKTVEERGVSGGASFIFILH